MKKHLTIVLFLVVGLWLLTIGNAYAHILKTSGSVGAVIHVTPEDDPIAGEPTEFYFEFKDKENKFKPELCECKVSVLKYGQEVYSGSLFQNTTEPSLTNASFTYTFPEKNIYKVIVTGSPSGSSTFEPFTLDYDLRVERVSEKLNNQTSEQKQQDNPTKHLPILFAAFIAFVAIMLFLKTRKGGDRYD